MPSSRRILPYPSVRFHLPHGVFIAKFLPQEFAASQEMAVFYNNQEYSIWRGVKRKPEENTESRGKPLVVECELSGEEKIIKVNNSPIITLCTWDVEPDPKFDEEFFSS